MRASRRDPRSRLVAFALFVLLAVAGCYNLATPSFNPGDSRDVLAAIVRRGIVVSQPIAGQTACDAPELIPNSLYLTARMPDETAPRDVYIHAYRERHWDESKAEVDACQAAYQAAHPEAVVTRLDIPTFRVFGADWSPELTRALRSAFAEAAQAGG